MKINIISPHQIIFSGQFQSLVLPGATGQLTILPHHAPLLTPLKAGKLKLRTEEQEKIFNISAGVLEVNWQEVNVLADVSVA